MRSKQVLWKKPDNLNTRVHLGAFFVFVGNSSLACWTSMGWRDRSMLVYRTCNPFTGNSISWSFGHVAGYHNVNQNQCVDAASTYSRIERYLQNIRCIYGSCNGLWNRHEKFEICCRVVAMLWAITSTSRFTISSVHTTTSISCRLCATNSNCTDFQYEVNQSTLHLFLGKRKCVCVF